MTMMDEPTYAEIWSESINDTYADPDPEYLLHDEAEDGESLDDTMRRVLMKAARCLRYGESATFTGGELDLVRYLMPAHEVHQSGAVRWVNDNYGNVEAGS